MIFEDFLHVFTFLKLVGSCRKIFFGKSDFFPKIPNFCHIDYPLPQKRDRKIPTICMYLPNTPLLSKLGKNELWNHFQNSLQVQKIQKLLWVHKPSKPTIDFLEMPTPVGESLCHLVGLDVNLLSVFYKISPKRKKKLPEEQDHLENESLSRQIDIFDVPSFLLVLSWL